MPGPSPLLLAALPAIAEGGMNILGGLIAPSMKKKWKWERKHLDELTKQRLGSINKSMKPTTPYFNMARNAPQMNEMLSKLLAGKADMYMGQNAGRWDINFPQLIQQLGAPPAPVSAPGAGPVTPGSLGGRLPPWAR